MQTAVKIPKCTFLQQYAYFHKWPLSVLFQSVLGYGEMKSGLPSTVTVEYLLSARPPDGLTSPSLSFPERVGERKEKRDKQYRICQYQPRSHNPPSRAGPKQTMHGLVSGCSLAPCPHLPACPPASAGSSTHLLPTSGCQFQ